MTGTQSIKLSLIIFFSVALFSCGEPSESARKAILPQAQGAPGEIILVMDSSQYAGNLGRAIRNAFNVPMEALPQDEMLYDMHYVNPLRVNNVLKKAKNLIYVTTLEDKSDDSKKLRQLFTDEALKKIYRDTSKYLSIKNDEYAIGQVVMHLYGKNGDILADKINSNDELLRSILEKYEQERLKKKLFASREKLIENNLKEKHGYSIQIPYGYDLAKNLPDFSWIRFLDVQYEKNIFIYHEEYQSQNQLKDMQGLREKITSLYLRDSEKPDKYVTMQPILPMITDTITFKNKFALANKGLWKVSDNSAGGPYVSYSFVDERIGRIYYIEGYVYAPGTQKKNYVQELDAILSTFDTPTEAAQQ